MKRPAFQFYPADWRKDSALQSCGMAARGLWHEMVCVMHECDPYGHLAVNGAPMTSAQLARLVGESERSVRNWLVELKAAGVYSETPDAVIYSRRMVKDEALRNTRAEAGRLGGNPALLNQKDKQQVNHDANQDGKQSPTPSSSSSSSSSKTEKHGSRFALTELPEDWLTYCKTERPELDPVRVFTDFRDYWISVAGAKGRKADWLATWRTWVRRQEVRRVNGHESWWSTDATIMAKALELGISTRGMSRDQLKGEIQQRLAT